MLLDNARRLNPNPPRCNLGCNASSASTAASLHSIAYLSLSIRRYMTVMLSRSCSCCCEEVSIGQSAGVQGGREGNRGR